MDCEGRKTSLKILRIIIGSLDGIKLVTIGGGIIVVGRRGEDIIRWGRRLGLVSVGFDAAHGTGGSRRRRTSPSIRVGEPSPELLMRVRDAGAQLWMTLGEAFSDDVVDETVAIDEGMAREIAPNTDSGGILVLGERTDKDVDFGIGDIVNGVGRSGFDATENGGRWVRRTGGLALRRKRRRGKVEFTGIFDERGGELGKR